MTTVAQDQIDDSFCDRIGAVNMNLRLKRFDDFGPVWVNQVEHQAVLATIAGFEYQGKSQVHTRMGERYRDSGKAPEYTGRSEFVVAVDERVVAEKG